MAPGVDARYTYDTLGRRIQRKVDVGNDTVVGLDVRHVDNGTPTPYSVLRIERRQIIVLPCLREQGSSAKLHER